MRTKQGTVTKAAMHNTVTVTVHRHVVHPLYKKSFRVSKKFLADTDGKTYGIGDLVTIAECRPLSKRKHFRVTELLKAAPRVSEMVEEQALSGVIERSASPSSSSSL